MLQLFQSSTRHGHALPHKDSRLASEALEQMPVATMLCDPIDHRVTFANRVAREARTDSLLQMLDEMPINVMMADPKTFVINYANRTTIEKLKDLRAFLPVDPENLVGTSIDVFHKHPEHQRALLSDPNNLPHSARIRVGDQTLLLKASAVMDKNGAYVGMMVSWSVITKQIAITDQFENEVKGVVDTVSVASTELYQPRLPSLPPPETSCTVWPEPSNVH